MESFLKYMQTVVSVSVLYSIISLLIPDGELKKYTRFATGLVVMACILKPVAGFKNIKLDDLHFDEYNYSETEYSDRVAEVYKARLEEEIKQKFGVDVKVVTDSNFNITQIITDSDKKQEIEEYFGLN